MSALPDIAHGKRLVVVVGASGAGKDSLLRGWRRAIDAAAPSMKSIHFARRVITRPSDPNEDHEPTTLEAFDLLRRSDALATWWEAHGLRYGIRRSELAWLAAGGWVVVNGSREHLPAMRHQAPGLRVVEVVAPPAVLAERLAARGRETAQGVGSRLVRRITVPVEPDLQLGNDGTLEDGLRALQRWWASLGQR